MGNIMSNLAVKLRRLYIRHWQAMTAIIVLGLGIAGALTWKLASLLPGYSPRELDTYQASTSLRHIWESPFDAPYHILTHAFTYVVPNNVLATRLASVVWSWVLLVIFGALVYSWYGTRTAIIATAMFGTSAWFLHVARLGSPEVCFLGIIALVACGVWLRERKAGLAVIIGLIFSAALLYTPGMVWFVAIGLLWQWKHIDHAFKKHLGPVTIGTIGFLAGIAPLAWHLYKHPDMIKQWLVLPDTWAQPLHLLHNLVDVPLAIFYRGQSNPETWLGRLPVLSIVGVVGFSLGTYIFVKHVKLARVKLFAGLGILGSVVIALSDGAIPITIFVPFIYIVVAVGLDYLVERWLMIFPRNPLARSTGAFFFVIIIAMSCIYNLRSYFVAWPQAMVTRQVFTIKKP
jgi:hypothetical protein